MNFFLFRNINTISVLGIGLAILLTMLAAVSILFFPSSYAPLLVLAGIVAVVGLVIFLKNPGLALYFAIFVVLFPTGIISTQVQSYLNRSITLLVFVLCLIYLYINRKPLILNSATIFMGLFIVWGLITLFWSADITLSITVLQSYVLRLLLFLFVLPNMIRSEQQLNGLMKFLALSGWVLAGITLVTFFIEGYTPGTRFKVFDVNSNSGSLSIIISAVGILWLASGKTERENRRYSLLAYLFLIVTVFCVAISGSRGSALTLGFTLALCWFWPDTRRWGRVGLVIIICGTFLTPFIYSTLIDRFFSLGSELLLGGREDLWRLSWKLIVDHFWTGVGIGRSENEILTYLRSSYFFISVKNLSRAPIHNPILLLWAETGLPGLLLYLAAALSAVFEFFHTYKYYKNNQKMLGDSLAPFFPLMIAFFAGYLISWVKGGGAERDHSFFLLLSLLMLPTSFIKNMLKKPSPGASETIPPTAG